MPISIIAGMRDRVVTTERQSARLHAELPSSTFDTVKGAGHMIHYIAPDLVLAAIFEASQPGRSAQVLTYPESNRDARKDRLR